MVDPSNHKHLVDIINHSVATTDCHILYKCKLYKTISYNDRRAIIDESTYMYKSTFDIKYFMLFFMYRITYNKIQ